MSLTINDTAKQFYVYTYTNPIDMKVFYIGKGSGYRLYRHLKDAINFNHQKNYNRHLFNKIKLISDLGHPPIIEKIFETEDESLAYQKEAELVKQIGLENLCNLDWGGLGAFRFTDEQKLKLSIAHKGKIRSEDTINKFKEWLLENGNPFKGKKHSEESKRKNSESKKKYYETHDGYWKGKVPQIAVEKSAEARRGKPSHMLGKRHTEETKLRIGFQKRGVKQSQETIDKRMAKLRITRETPEYKKHLSEAVAKWWAERKARESEC